MEPIELMKKAREARSLSHSPYSNFPVGAALLCKDGTVYLGANVENASYPLSMCAERNALYHALMEGRRKEEFLALAVCAKGRPVSPCGACRQVLTEFLPPEAPVYLGNLELEIKETTVGDLLPYAFEEKDLG